jgi:phenylacetate-coenzyme A ligase PaaK-like adenylate-forming protein
MKFKIQDYLYPVDVIEHYNRMKSAPYWSPDKLASWSLERRKAITAHAYKNVPYYRKLFDESESILTRSTIRGMESYSDPG